MSADRAAAGRSARPRRARLLPLLAAVSLLGGCERIDPAMREVCLATLPALVGKARPITVETIEPIGERGETLRLVWRAGVDGAAHETACAFGEETSGDGRGSLIGVRIDGVDLPLPRLFALRRFWLAVPDLRAAALAEVRVVEAARK
ncbi:MAG: hypothetical protein LWW93_11440 [Hyphomicrobiales bacterium]|nr:hypothetical protein [Hyphomicrobiales bacterium]